MVQTTAQVLVAVLWWWLYMANILRKMRILICVVVALHHRIDGIEDMDMNQDDELNGVFSNQPSTLSTETTSTSRKRRRNNNDVLVETLSNGFELMGKRFKEATTELAAQVRRVAHKANLAEKAEKLWEELIKIPGFTKEEMVKAVIMIGKDETMLIMFSTLPPNVKAMVIRDYIK